MYFPQVFPICAAILHTGPALPPTQPRVSSHTLRMTGDGKLGLRNSCFYRFDENVDFNIFSCLWFPWKDIMGRTVWSVLSCQTRRCLFLGRLWVYEGSDCCSRTVWEPRSLEISWYCSSSYFVYNFNKTPWFLLMWMVRFVTFVHKDLCQGTNPCEQKWQIWPSTSTGTMVVCWSCKQSWSWSNAN